MFGKFAFTTVVARQDDIGIDFYCVLSEPSSDGKLLRAGPFFTAQVRSEGASFEYATDPAIDWIWEQDNPLFACTVNQNDLACNIYAGRTDPE